MPFKLHVASAAKSINHIWSSKRIQNYWDILNKYLTKYPSKEYSEDVLKLKKILNLKTNENLTASNFAELPLEYPHLNTEVVTYEVEVQQKMTQFLQPPAQYRENDNWDNWIKHLESYFSITDIDDAVKQKQMLLYLLGPDRRAKLENFISPQTVEDDDSTFDTIKEAAKKLWGEADSSQALTDLFSTTQGGDTVYVYAMKVKNLAMKANLTDGNIIVNKFVSGLKSSKIRFELAKQQLTEFDTALKQAQLLEKILNEDKEGASVNKVTANKNFNKKNYKGPKKNFDPKQDRQQQDKRQQDKQQQGTKVAKNQCFYCKKYNHWKWQCNKYKRDQANRNTNQVTENLGSIKFDDN